MKYLLLLLLVFVSFAELNAQLPYAEFHANYSKKASSAGSLNTICIFIKFSGESEFANPRSYYDGFFNSISSASLKSYYREVSYNKLDISGYLYPECASTINLSYTFPKPRGYFQDYSASNTIGYASVKEGRLREHEILDSAVKFIAPQVPSSLDLDFDNDGLVDNVMFILSGSAGAWGDVGLWPHSGALDSYDVRLNGERVFHYSIHLDEYVSASVFAHETFHVFGAPDLYRYFVNANPIGSWDLMTGASGHMGAYMKYKYSNKKWITDIPKISKSGRYSLSPLMTDTNNCYRIDSPYSTDEYFVLEYRKQSGLYESSLPGSGLLVYRINTKAGDGDGYGPPDEVYLFRKGGTPTVEGTVASAYFSSAAGRTAINDYTSNPKSFLSNGGKAGLDIKNIGVADAVISFDVTIVNCSIVQPSQNSILSQGAPLSVLVSAKDSALISKVELFLDNALVATLNSYPYSYQLSTSGILAGSHVLKARATSISGVYKDDEINIYMSESKPVVQIITPHDSVTVQQKDTLTILINAVSPKDSVVAVKYSLDGVQIADLSYSPFSYSLVLSATGYGKHILKITAVDNLGGEGSSQIIIFVVSTLLAENFEGTWPPMGWSINSPVFGWYQSPKGAFEGSSCAGTRNYHAAGDAILETPEITIEDNTQLEFYWCDKTLDITKSVAGKFVGHDSTYCEVSVNGGPYSLLAMLSSPGVETQYHKEVVDLSAYNGKNIKIRWRDISDESLDAQGTALDNVKVTAHLYLTEAQYETTGAISGYSLMQNYPNPFNPSTTIEYYIPYTSNVKITIYNVLGQPVAVLINSIQQAGHKQVRFDAGNLPSGVYFCRFESFSVEGQNSLSKVQKLILQK